MKRDAHPFLVKEQGRIPVVAWCVGFLAPRAISDIAAPFPEFSPKVSKMADLKQKVVFKSEKNRKNP